MLGREADYLLQIRLIQTRLLPLASGLAAIAFVALRTAGAAGSASIDLDLTDVTVPRLEKLYAEHRYTVTQVVHWYIARIEKYDGIYRAIETRDFAGALAAAAREDAAPASSPRPPLWGVPIVVKANTSIRGLVTTDGWAGFAIPGHELMPPKDAPVVARLRAAGAIILGKTNMPDFAGGNTTRSTSFGRTGNAYDVRFSPGGSSGGTVTAVSANFAVLGTGTDTSNSIRMPASTSSVVGVLPTRGLTSIAGIAPLDWLLDNTGPITRDVTDAAIALDAMAGEDPEDFRTEGSAAAEQPGPFTKYLDKDALKGKRFGVPAFMMASQTQPQAGPGRQSYMQPDTRAMFLKSLDELRAAGATVVIEDSILPAAFQQALNAINSRPYRLDGTESFLRDYGSPEYRSVADYARVVGSPLPPTLTGQPRPATAGAPAQPAVPQVVLKTDPHAESNFFEPQRKALALYNETLEKFRLDGFVYPAAQMQPPDETMPQNGQLSRGPGSATGWVNRIGVPSLVVPGGFYSSGLPFGLEIAGRRFQDGTLLGFAYAYEQATKHRHSPVLVDRGLLPATTLKTQDPSTASIDRDLAEVTIPQLRQFYASHRYTVTQVVRWYIARIEKYDGIYQALENRDFQSALETAAREDREAATPGARPPLWGVPLVVKANTSIEGLVTTDGWSGFVIPGHELTAPKDAPVVARLKTAGAVLIGRTNMPDFASSNTTRSTSFGRTGNAYDVRFSPGGSSGGTVTAVTANFAVVGTGTDTGNSIRTPSSTSSLVGVLPTRGLTSIAGIVPLDWLLDNTGPIARTVTDAAIALDAMAEPVAGAQPGPLTKYLNKDALKGKRFGVPAFMLAGQLQPETRAMFLKAVEEVRAAGATVVFDDAILPAAFQKATVDIDTRPYRLDGTESFLREYGPAEYHSSAEYARAVGTPLAGLLLGIPRAPEAGTAAPAAVPQVVLAADPNAEANLFAPQRRALAMYNDTLDRFHLDGYVYPAAQMQPPDESMAQDGRLSRGPSSATGWANRLGVPAIAVPGGFYPTGLPFGLEFSARRFRDGDLFGFVYAYEQATKHRHPPILVEHGMLTRQALKEDRH
jgi:Asp-tRNA(Asn)/Glu-tRNA(Gln) amidotransferase A subunit family amidase